MMTSRCCRSGLGLGWVVRLKLGLGAVVAKSTLDESLLVTFSSQFSSPLHTVFIVSPPLISWCLICSSSEHHRGQTTAATGFNGNSSSSSGKENANWFTFIPFMWILGVSWLRLAGISLLQKDFLKLPLLCTFLTSNITQQKKPLSSLVIYGAMLVCMVN